MTTIRVFSSKKREVIDITNTVESQLGKGSGVCTLFLKHTTASLTTADLDPGTDLDFLDAIEKIIPHLSYRHPHDPSHTPDHIASSLIGSSLVIPFEKSRLTLGTWQRVILVELDGPRERELVISVAAV